MAQTKQKSVKVGVRKRFVPFLVAAYVVSQSFVYFFHTGSQNVLNGLSSSVISSHLSEFKGSSKANRRARIAGTTSTDKAETQRDEKVPAVDYNNPLERDFSRIPAYLQGSSNSSLFGYVMRDLANRFLAPSSAQQRRRRLLEGPSATSNILVACPGANALHFEIKKKNIATIDSKKELIKSLEYKIGASFLVETMYNGHNAISMDSDTGFLGGHGSKPTDILLAVLDPAQGQEDSVISSGLEESIRSGSIQFATFRISGSLSSTSLYDDNTATKNGKTKMQGIETAKIFLSAGYKLQVLSSSHAPTDGLNPYGPNTLLKNVEDVKAFLRFGAGLAQKAEDTRVSKNKSKNLTLPSKIIDVPIIFHSVLFATRGLDLAIPSRKQFLELDHFPTTDFVISDVEKHGAPFLNCSASSPLKAVIGDDSKYEMSCFGKKIHMGENHMTIDDGNNIISAELLHSHNNLSLSEAVCLKCAKSVMDSDKQSVVETKCTNRILSIESASSNLSNQESNKSQGPNLLAIELRGVNQIMLNTSLAQFQRFSEKRLGLDHFPNFVQSATILNRNDGRQWWELWDKDVIKGDAYKKYRGINQCDPTSHGGDINSTVYHGSQMARMFCFDYDRPNCLSGSHAATHLLNHAQKFIKRNTRGKERWASYITLIDGMEETETLAGALHFPLEKFLSNIKHGMTIDEWSNTVITIFSHDVKEPILFLKANNRKTRLLKERKALFTSDLQLIMRSILSTTDLRSEFPTHLLSGHTNVKAIPSKGRTLGEHRSSEGELGVPPSVLSFYADIPKEHKMRLIKQSSKQATKRATVFQGCECTTTFIPWFPCDIHPWGIGDKNQDPRDTYILVDCPGHPIHLEINVIRNDRYVKRFAKRRSMSASSRLDDVNIIFLEIDSVSQEYADRHFPKTRELLKKYRIKRNGNNDYECIDGLCSAEFPYTSLAGANSVPNQVAALSGCISSPITQDFCGLDPKNTTEVLTVCNDPHSMYHGLRLQRIRRGSKIAYWCPDRALGVTRTPWLFGVSDSKGYINFFGEEFCYNHSPYVTQGNVFPTFYQDIESHLVFCSLVDRKIAKESLEVHEKHKWGVDISDPCIGGDSCSSKAEKSTVSLQFIEQIWDTYVDQPKFAFVNAIAAHDYSKDWEMMIPRAEAYDEHVHNFLARMLSRKNSEDTVIIVRSDHGLQKGPSAMDYSVQREHRHPWTEILIPQNLVVSERVLFNNQVRMLTGYDLYKTIRYLMSDRTDSRDVGGGIPDWAFDILAEEIPRDRTCEDAKVDPNLCRREEQARQYGVCNPLDTKQAGFC